MASNLETKIDRIAAAKEAISAAIAGKGVTVPDGTLIDGMAALIESIEAGGGWGGDFETFTFIPATTGISEWFSFDKIPFFIICVRKSFTYNDEYYTDLGETPFCATIANRYQNKGIQQLISLYNNSSSYYSGKLYLSNSQINGSILPSNYSPLSLRWNNNSPCYFAFFANENGGNGLRVGAEYTVIVAFREDSA